MVAAGRRELRSDEQMPHVIFEPDDDDDDGATHAAAAITIAKSGPPQK